MSASKRFLLPACAFALLFAGFVNGCAGSDCLRDSDCDSELECRRGTCQVPIPKTVSGADGGDVDGGDVDGGDAAMSGGTAGMSQQGSAGKAGGETTGVGGEAGASMSQ